MFHSKNIIIHNMYVVAVVCVLIYVSAAAPTAEDAQAKTLNYKNENDGLGNYEFSFETSNGIRRTETGRLVNIGEPNEHLEVRGTYTYLSDPEGNLVVVNYTADENGYHVDFPETDDLIPPELGLPPAVVATLLG